MTRFFIVAKAILGLLPVILEALQAIEKSLPVGGQGATKLGLLREAVAGAYDTAGELGVAFQDLWPTIERVVSAAVTMFNKAGVFKTTSAE